MQKLAWHWVERADAPPPAAAVAWGAAADRLLARLRQCPDAQRAALAATGNSELLIVLGPAAQLPWVDGIAYAAPAAAAPALWLPVLSAPSVSADLLAQALARRYPRSPLLLWPAPSAVVPLDRALPLTPALLDRLAQTRPAAGHA